MRGKRIAEALTRRAWLLALLLGAGLLVIGVAHGEPGVILQKAIRVCLECVGIG